MKRFLVTFTLLVLLVGSVFAESFVYTNPKDNSQIGIIYNINKTELTVRQMEERALYAAAATYANLNVSIQDDFYKPEGLEDFITEIMNKYGYVAYCDSWGGMYIIKESDGKYYCICAHGDKNE